MDAIATYSILNFNVNIPDWLQDSLRAASSAADEPVGDHTLLIAEAFKFAYQLHEGQYRKSGEPYIAHPIAVADLLRDLGGNSTMVAAGFLHDVVEDTEITPQEIESRFGVEVRNLVEGVTKLSKFNFSSKTERQAENFRRMFLAMAADIRVIVVKLADRLHNMRTLEYLKPEKQVQIAQETRDIFAPLANRLGIGRFKWELEDLAFKYLETNAYREIQSLVSERRSDREQRLKEVSELLRERIHKTGVHCVDISSRPKHLYGIYQKMQRQNKGFHEIYDIAAMRVIVESKEECYRALAIVHDLFRPIPGRFKDYIGLPKPNRYQSLHTGVIGFNGRPIEVQIRTLEMHHVAEWGIAAHWKYKESGGSHTTKFTADDEKLTWLRQLLEWQKDLKDAQEYMENIKDNLFDEDVYVFTPDGDVVALSRGATAVDFAYRIHTEVGNHCAGVRVNGEWRVLDCPLKNGDIVEILTTKNAHPSLDWLNFVVTASARNRIRQWFKRSHREENVARGRELLEKELGKKGFEALLKSAPMQIVAERCNYHKVEDLLAGLGHGAVTLNFVVKRLREQLHAGLDNEPEESEVLQQYSSSTPIHLQSQLPSKKHPIAGVEGLLYRLAACCNPLPGESIIGVVTRTKGISIHRQGCVNVENVLGERLVPVSWNPTDIDDGRPQTYPVNVQIEVIDRVGVFKDILSRLSDQNINVRKAQVKTQYGKPALIDLCIDILNHQQLNRSFGKIQQMSDVLNIRRVSQVDECN